MLSRSVITWSLVSLLPTGVVQFLLSPVMWVPVRGNGRGITSCAPIPQWIHSHPGVSLFLLSADSSHTMLRLSRSALRFISISFLLPIWVLQFFLPPTPFFFFLFFFFYCSFCLEWDALPSPQEYISFLFSILPPRFRIWCWLL